MNKKTTLFLSCVSSEFHKEDPAQDGTFFSWRSHLERSLNALERGEFVVISQETTLGVEQGDLLQILEEAVVRSDYLVHLYGDLSGARAGDRSLRLLRGRHPDFLADEPELRSALAEDWAAISYTQWELYFGFHHGRQPLIYLASEGAPRSPSAEGRDDPGERESKERHLRFIRASCLLRPEVRNQDHLNNLVFAYLFKHGAFERDGLVASSAEARVAAGARIGEFIGGIARRLGIGREAGIAIAPSGGGKARLEAFESVALEAGISAPELAELAEERSEESRRRAEAEPSFDAYYDLAFDHCALGEYPEAVEAAKEAVRLAVAGAEAGKETDETAELREKAVDAFVLLHDASRLNHDVESAAEALLRGSGYFDQERDPVAWADYHLVLADYFHHIGHYQEAKDCLWGVEGATPDEDVEGVLDIYEGEYGGGDPGEEAEPKFAHALVLMANVENRMGNGEAALGMAGRARRIYTQLGPGAAQAIATCLLIESESLTALLRLGEGFVAAKAASDILQILAAQEPGNLAHRRDLSVALENVGRIREDQGDPVGALVEFERSLEIREGLAAQEPGNLAHRRDLSMALENVGRIREDQGDLVGALEEFERSLEICEGLAAQEPGNLAHRRDLSVALNNVGRIREKQGDLVGALEEFERSLEIRKGLAAQEPGNLALRRDLSVALENVGRIREGHGDLVAALEEFKRSREICEGLAAQEPGNLAHRRDLSIALNNVGRIREKQGDLVGALEEFGRSLEICKALAAQEPGNLADRRELCITLFYCGRVTGKTGSEGREKALRYLQESESLAQGVIEVGYRISEMKKNLIEIKNEILRLSEGEDD